MGCPLKHWMSWSGCWCAFARIRTTGCLKQDVAEVSSGTSHAAALAVLPAGSSDLDLDLDLDIDLAGARASDRALRRDLNRARGNALHQARTTHASNQRG
jgi:hypothetical protein